MKEEINTVEFTLDRQTHVEELKVGYSVVPSEKDGAPMTVQIIWINPANIKSTLTEDEWETIHAYIFREEQRRSAKRSTLDEHL